MAFPRIRKGCRYLLALMSLILVSLYLFGNGGINISIQQPVSDSSDSSQDYFLVRKSKREMNLPDVKKEVKAKTVKYPQKLTCQVVKSVGSKNFIHRMTMDDLTVEKCHSVCSTYNTSFMILFNQKECLCTDYHGSDLLLMNSDCQKPCLGNSQQECGNTYAGVFYRIARKDGMTSWTQWTEFKIEKKKTVIRSRFKDCDRQDMQKTRCLATVQTESNGKGDSELQKNFIGCFTRQSFIFSSDESQVAVESPYHCISACLRLSKHYAILLPEQTCLCSNSLGWSQPANLCNLNKNIGALVFSTQSINNNKVTLMFEPRQTEKLVAVVAHYRGGSTISSALFNLVPGSLSVYEPGIVFGREWPNVALFGREEERNDVFLSHVYPPWFDCDSSSLPGYFIKCYPRWGLEFNTGLEPLQECKAAAGPKNDISLCSAVLREMCLMSRIVSSKTTRVLNAAALTKFIVSNPHIHVIHTVRDPRGVLASRQHFSKWYRQDVVNHLRGNCWEVTELDRPFAAPDHRPNAHILYYEDLAIDVITAARNIYRDINMTFPVEVEEGLSKVSGGDQKRKQAYEIVQQHPETRVNSWIKSLPHDVVKQADSTSECKHLYSLYPDHYKPLEVLLPQQ